MVGFELELTVLAWRKSNFNFLAIAEVHFGTRIGLIRNEDVFKSAVVYTHGIVLDKVALVRCVCKHLAVFNLQLKRLLSRILKETSPV